MMQSLDEIEIKHFSRTKIIIQLSLVATGGLVLFLFESVIPRPLPWLKPGLANIATLFALQKFGLREALSVTLLRVCTGSLILGTLFNPAFVLSLGGGLAATLAMGATKNWGRKTFSVIGISLIGAFCHNLMQILLAYLIIVKHYEILFLVPIILLSSIFTGFVVGFITHFLLVKSERLLITANLTKI